MASSHRLARVCLLAGVFILATVVAHGQTPGSSGDPQVVSGTAPRSPVAQEPAEPEWRWGAATFGADASFTSAFVWRGWILDAGRCLQPDVWMTLGDVTVTSWASVHAMNGTGMRFDEHDLTVDYTRELKRVSLSAGWINYKTFGDDAGDTNEFYAGFTLSTPLHPGVQLSHDVNLGKGSYVSLSASQDFPIVPHLGGTAQVSVGYNHHQYTTVSGWSDIALALKFDIEVPSARMTLQPTIAYSHSLLPELFPSRVYGGFAVAFK